MNSRLLLKIAEPPKIAIYHRWHFEPIQLLTSFVFTHSIFICGALTLRGTPYPQPFYAFPPMFESAGFIESASSLAKKKSIMDPHKCKKCHRNFLSTDSAVASAPAPAI